MYSMSRLLMIFVLFVCLCMCVCLCVQEMCAQHWPLEENEPMEQGDITIKLLEEKDEEELTIRDLEISHSQVSPSPSPNLEHHTPYPHHDTQNTHPHITTCTHNNIAACPFLSSFWSVWRFSLFLLDWHVYTSQSITCSPSSTTITTVSWAKVVTHRISLQYGIIPYIYMNNHHPLPCK